MSRKRRILKGVGLAVLLLVVIGAGLALYVNAEWPSHTTPNRQPDAVKVSGDTALDGIRKGLAFLRMHQEADGHFVIGTLAPKPAFTALVVDAFVSSPDRYRIESEPFLQKAVDAIVGEQKAGGGIFSEIPGMSFSSYSTAVAVVALRHADPERLKPVIAKAARFLKRDQHTADGVSKGGFGYGSGARPDLNNTCSVLEALDAAGIPKDDPVWENAQAFINHCQNRSESNDQAWAGNDGGFIYCPIGLKKGAVGSDGRPAHASYGTMSYAGLISFLYSHVEPSDPRVQSAARWVRDHYDLQENVGKKDVGLYYYYRIMAKALRKFGVRHIVTPDGVAHDWARELSDHLLSLQKSDGRWVNDNTSFLEGDSIIVTAYVVRALSDCYDMTQDKGATE